MKSAIKRYLFVGIAFSLAALTVLNCDEKEIEGSLDKPHADKPPLPPVSGGSARTCPLTQDPSATPVAKTGPLPHSPFISVTFSGKVVRTGSRLALREVAGALYALDATPRARSFEGSDVRVTGRMDLSTRRLQVDAIEAAVL